MEPELYRFAAVIGSARSNVLACVMRTLNAFIQMEIGNNVLFIFSISVGCLVSLLFQLSIADIHFNQLFHPQVTCSVQVIVFPLHKPSEIYTQAYCSSELHVLLPAKRCF